MAKPGARSHTPRKTCASHGPLSRAAHLIRPASDSTGTPDSRSHLLLVSPRPRWLQATASAPKSAASTTTALSIRTSEIVDGPNHSVIPGFICSSIGGFINPIKGGSFHPVISGRINHNRQLEQRVPQDHPLRAVRKLTDAVLRTLSPEFDALYADSGRPSIAPEYILRALLLQVFYSVRSERLLVEQIDYNLLFR